MIKTKKKRKKPNLFGWKCFLDETKNAPDPSWITFNSLQSAIEFSNSYGVPYEISLSLENINKFDVYQFLEHLRSNIHQKGYDISEISVHSGEEAEINALLKWIQDWENSK